MQEVIIFPERITKKVRVLLLWQILTQIIPKLIFKVITEYPLPHSPFYLPGIPKPYFLDFKPVIGDFTIVHTPVCIHKL